MVLKHHPRAPLLGEILGFALEQLFPGCAITPLSSGVLVSLLVLVAAGGYSQTHSPPLVWGSLFVFDPTSRAGRPREAPRQLEGQVRLGGENSPRSPDWHRVTSWGTPNLGLVGMFPAGLPDTLTLF